jgi:hypothetical protein
MKKPRLAGLFSMRPRGLEPPRTNQPTRPSTLFGPRRCFHGRPDRPNCEVPWTDWTQWTEWMLSPVLSRRALSMRTVRPGSSDRRSRRFGYDRPRAYRPHMLSMDTFTEPDVYIFRAALVGVRGVSRKLAVRADKTLEDVHRLLQAAFEWDDDHLYAFWPSGKFWVLGSSAWRRFRPPGLLPRFR